MPRTGRPKKEIPMASILKWFSMGKTNRQIEALLKGKVKHTTICRRLLKLRGDKTLEEFRLQLILEKRRRIVDVRVIRDGDKVRYQKWERYR